VIVDAIGFTQTELNDTQPLDKDPTTGLDKLPLRNDPRSRTASPN